MPSAERLPVPLGISKNDRRGVTIVELLVVIAIIIGITAVTVPVVAPAIQQRKVREATRLVSSYFAAARSRAAEIGRPVAVVIERFNPGLASDTASVAQNAAQTPNLQMFSMNLSIAEAPAPYAGDSIGSTANVSAVGSGSNNLLLNYFPSGDQYQYQQINIGDRIRLNCRGPLYSITSAPLSSTNIINGAPWTLSPVPANCVQPPSYPSYPSYAILYPQSMSNGNSVNLPFEIFRQPYKSTAVAPLQLPEGIVIDLNYSGMGSAGVFAGTGNNQLISFAPGGSIDMVYDNGDQHPTGPIFLLLGRREQVVFNGYTPPAPLNANNLIDGNSYWVSIGYQSGQVLTNENYFNNGGNVQTARSLATGSSGGVITTTGGN